MHFGYNYLNHSGLYYSRKLLNQKVCYQCVITL